MNLYLIVEVNLLTYRLSRVNMLTVAVILLSVEVNLQAVEVNLLKRLTC